MNKLIILEDDLNFSRVLFNYISNKIPQMQEYQLLIDGEEIIDILHKLNDNDIILLDLEMPKINGIEIMNIIKKSKNKNPYIIIISGNVDLINKSVEYKELIYKILEKPFTFNKLIEIINEIISQSKSDDLEIAIRNELSLFNFNMSARGYIYLKESIKIALLDTEQLTDIKNNIYSKVSKNYNNINIMKIKWSIEKCIDSLYKTTNISILNNYFYMDVKEKLTPKLFITTVVDKLSYHL